MKPAYFIAIAVIVVVVGMLTYPSLHGFVGTVDRTGFLPILSAAITFLPYAFLLFVVYAIFKRSRG